MLAVPSLAGAQAVGQLAPAFSLPDQTGALRSLDGFKGHWVVLEWVNPGCPFVQKHYGSGNMQKTQKAATAKGVVWLTVNSSAPGKQGALDAKQAAAFIKEQAAANPTGD